MIHVAALWRHPIKSHGREEIASVTLTKGQTMPWDRHWAVTHERSKFDADAPDWVHCRNFMIGASTPALAGIWAKFDAATNLMQLRHVDLGDISFDPDDLDDAARFVAWIKPICPPDKFQPTGLAKAPERGMTDTDFASIAIMTQASHDAVVGHLAHAVEIERWRGNIWLSGAAPWEERDWIGKTLRIGTAELAVQEHIGRCKHTMANPVTGLRDTDTLGALQTGFGHTDFGVYAQVIKGGKIAKNDKVEVV